MARVTIDPLTRIEGHLAVKVDVEDNRVSEAWSAGEMFRGFELIMRGRDPMDAQQITQRICGLCPVSHGIASIYAQDDAYGITIPDNGWRLRNLVQAGNFIQDHISHFYLLSAPDFIDLTRLSAYQGDDPKLSMLRDWLRSQENSPSIIHAAPLLPRYEAEYLSTPELADPVLKHYLSAYEMRAIGHQMTALIAGKQPHTPALVPGGITLRPDIKILTAYATMLDKLRRYIDDAMINDLLTIAKRFPDQFSEGRSYGDYLAFGGFIDDQITGGRYLPAGTLIDGKLESVDISSITEDLRFSWFDSASGMPPLKGDLSPAPDKSGAYSWIKAPRYKGHPMEVGPHARLVIGYLRGQPEIKQILDWFMRETGISLEQFNSSMGRHAARVLETKLIADRTVHWIRGIKLGSSNDVCEKFTIPDEAIGIGLTEAPRGALGHWIEIKGKKVHRYECVVPTTWNCSPRDDKGQRGPMEQALINTRLANPDQPIEAVRVVRAYDPCLACSVH